MKSISQPSQENQLSVIRTETVLSRFPIHNLGRKGQSTSIHITQKNDDGEVSLHWRISPNRDYGEPGQLAYKLDTIAINSRLDKISEPIPEVVRLGSLNQLCRELSTDKRRLKNALLQNAGALINAQFTYKDKDGTERYFKGIFTRYSVVFTGEKLPNEEEAESVYIILNKLYRDILNSAPVRPLNYDYLKQLPPAAQRFYEIISYKIFAAIKYNQLAKLPYSEYCMYSARRRHLKWEQVKKQMYKVHRLHIKSGYIEKVTYEKFFDAEGNTDWVMCYTPGKKARDEYKAFTSKRLRSETNDTLTGLAQTLYERGIRPASKAKQLAAQYSEERITEKLDMHDFGVVDTIGGLIHAIEDDWQPTDEQRKARVAAERQTLRNKITGLNQQKDTLNQSHKEQSNKLTQELTEQHPEAFDEAVTKALTETVPFVSQRYEHNKPFHEQSDMVQGSLRLTAHRILHQNFPDVFKTLDENHNKAIAPIDTQITELEQQLRT